MNFKEFVLYSLAFIAIAVLSAALFTIVSLAVMISWNASVAHYFPIKLTFMEALSFCVLIMMISFLISIPFAGLKKSR